MSKKEIEFIQDDLLDYLCTSRNIPKQRCTTKHIDKLIDLSQSEEKVEDVDEIEILSDLCNYMELPKEKCKLSEEYAKLGNFTAYHGISNASKISIKERNRLVKLILLTGKIPGRTKDEIERKRKIFESKAALFQTLSEPAKLILAVSSDYDTVKSLCYASKDYLAICQSGGKEWFSKIREQCPEYLYAGETIAPKDAFRKYMECMNAREQISRMTDGQKYDLFKQYVLVGDVVNAIRLNVPIKYVVKTINRLGVDHLFIPSDRAIIQYYLDTNKGESGYYTLIDHLTENFHESQNDEIAAENIVWLMDITDNNYVVKNGSIAVMRGALTSNRIDIAQQLKTEFNLDFDDVKHETMTILNSGSLAAVQWYVRNFRITREQLQIEIDDAHHDDIKILCQENTDVFHWLTTYMHLDINCLGNPFANIVI